MGVNVLGPRRLYNDETGLDEYEYDIDGYDEWEVDWHVFGRWGVDQDQYDRAGFNNNVSGSGERKEDFPPAVMNAIWG